MAPTSERPQDFAALSAGADAYAGWIHPDQELSSGQDWRANKNPLPTGEVFASILARRIERACRPSR